MTYLPLHILSVFHSKIQARESTLDSTFRLLLGAPALHAAFAGISASSMRQRRLRRLPWVGPTWRPRQLHWPPRNTPSAEAMLPRRSTRAALRMESAPHHWPLRAAPRAQATPPQSATAGRSPRAASVYGRGPLPTCRPRRLHRPPRAAPHAQARHLCRPPRAAPHAPRLLLDYMLRRS
jgi:hypothetical protein